MTKEEILDKHHNLNLGMLSITEKQIQSAMDEYAKQEAVAFNKWFIMYKNNKLTKCEENKEEYMKWLFMTIEDYYDIFSNKRYR